MSGFYTSLKSSSLRLRANGYINCVWGGSIPHLREGVELGGRVWYSVNARHNGHNLLKSTRHLALCMTRTSCKFFGIGDHRVGLTCGRPWGKHLWQALCLCSLSVSNVMLK